MVEWELSHEIFEQLMGLKKYWKQSALIKDQKLKSKNGGLEIKGTENEGPEKEGPENREPFKLF